MPSGSSAAGCATTAGGVPAVQAPTQAVATAITFAEQQLGKPYLWGGTGPDAFDCSGLVMMAYRAAGIDIARTSQAQWATEQRVPASQVQPGDLVFFAGADGTPTSPGHVGLVIGNGKMIEAYATGFPIRVSPRYRSAARVDRFHPTLGSGRSRHPGRVDRAFDGRHANPGHRHLSVLTSLWLTGLVGSRPGCRRWRYTVRKE